MIKIISKKNISIIIGVFLTTLVILMFSVKYINNYKGCENMTVHLWNGETMQDNLVTPLQNFKFRNVTQKCLRNSLNHWELSYNNNVKLATINFDGQNSTYQINEPETNKKHLELFENFFLDSYNFTIINDKRINSIDSIFINEKKETSIKIINNLKNKNIDLILPDIIVTNKNNTLKACTTIEGKYIEAIRLNFDIIENKTYKHEQVVCTNTESFFEDDSKGNLCCQSALPNNTMKYGVIRWRGDKKKLIFKEKYTTIHDMTSH